MNSSIHYRWIAYFGEDSILAEKMKELRLSKGDIVIFNTGVHFNDPSEYRMMLDAYAKRFANTTAFPASMYFVESTPQHNPESPSGYFLRDTYHNLNDPAFTYSERGCQPLHLSDNKDDLAARDWRNDIMHDVMNGTRWRIVPIAKMLQSQYDAHLGYAHSWNAHHVLSGTPSVKLDCLHWSMDSGIFRYILTRIFNTLLQEEESLIDPEEYSRPDSVLPDKTGILESTRYGRETFVYLNGTKHRLKNGIITFNRLGLSFEKVKHLTELEFDLIPWGLDVE
jgi:hypothetical protein